MFPYPLFLVAITGFWLLLNAFTLGHLVLGLLVATISCWAMAALRPVKPKISKPYLIPGLVATIMWDIARSNLAVASLIINRKQRDRVSGFVTIPLELKNPVGLAILAIILTSTPGSAWLEYNSKVGTLLIHVLDLRDEEEWRGLVKHRYEAKLIEIFQS